MAYPGNSGLDPAVQQRILTAFKEAVRLYREGHGDEARTILRSIADVDAGFTPAHRLEQAIAAGAPVDLAQLIGEVAAHGDVDVEDTMAKARQAFAAREFQEALTLAQAVLRELPGHPDARQLVLEAQGRMRGGGEIQANLDRARQALDAGLAEEARGFLRLARNLDPNHPDLAALERRLQIASKPLAVDTEPDFEFEVFEQVPEPPPAGPPPPPPGSPAPATAFGLPPAPAAAAPAAPAMPPAIPNPPATATPSPMAVPPAMPIAPMPPPAAAPPPPVPAGGFRFDEAASDASVAFGAEPEGGFAPAPAPAAQHDSGAARVQALLEQGQQEFDRSDFQGSIDTWSRIYLIDVSNAEADRRIEQARRRKEEVERRAEQHFYEAREAFDQHRLEDARALCGEVLKLVPQHLEAHDLLQRLETPAAPPPPNLTAEEDLFRDEFVPAAISAPSGTAPAMRGAAARPPERFAPAGDETAARVARPRVASSLPLVWIGIGFGVLVLLGGGFLLLRGKVFSGGGAAVTESLAESEQLAKQGRVQEALQLLQSLQGQAEGAQANRVNQKILEYQHRLKAKATPKPVSESKAVREALAAGRHVKAMQLVRESLAKVPGDAELVGLQSEITTYAAIIPALADAVAAKNWESIRTLSDQVLKAHPDDTEALRLWSVSTFNVAVLHLRKYQVAEGHSLLVEFSRRVSDPDAERLQQLAKSYLSRPADPRYQIYVSNVDLRQLE